MGGEIISSCACFDFCRGVVCTSKSSRFQKPILIKYKLTHFSTTTVSRKYQSVVDAYVTVMPTFALLQAMQCYNVNVNTTPQVKNFVQPFFCIFLESFSLAFQC